MPAELALSIRRVDVEEYPIARRLVVTAFADEPFVHGMFGDAATARFAGLAADYAAWPTATGAIVLGAEAAGHLVGVATATLPGACRLCDVFDRSTPSIDSDAARLDHEFQLACRQAHLTNRLPAHAHIATVATEPLLHGSGIGRELMSGMADQLRSAGAAHVVLECLTSRAAFYGRCGFRVLEEFADPTGPELRVVLMRSDL